MNLFSIDSGSTTDGSQSVPQTPTRRNEDAIMAAAMAASTPCRNRATVDNMLYSQFEGAKRRNTPYGIVLIIQFVSKAY